MKRSPLLWAGAILVGVVLAAAALANLSPFDPNAQDITARLAAPGARHLLNTDNFGRDLFSRILFAMRTLFAISFGAVGVSLIAGGSLGVLAAWCGGTIDRIVMRSMDVLFAFPIILLAIGVIAVLGPGAAGTAIAIAVVYTPIFARTLRAPALQLVAGPLVEAARATGCGVVRILTRHVLWNLSTVILVQTSLCLSTAILVEASLSFLGLGTQPPTPSLGRMLSESRVTMMLSPWPSIVSGVAILLASLGFNLLGDGLQDRLAPPR